MKAYAYFHSREIAKEAAAHVNRKLKRSACSYSAGPDGAGLFQLEAENIRPKELVSLLGEYAILAAQPYPY